MRTHVALLRAINLAGRKFTTTETDTAKLAGALEQEIARRLHSAANEAYVARIGSDVITAPFKVIKQLLHHPLTDSGLKQFLADWEKAKK